MGACEFLTPKQRVRLHSIQAAASLVILAGAGLSLLAPWPTFKVLSLFLTPLGLCLGIIGFSTLVADDLNRRTLMLVLLSGTAGLVTLAIPAITTNVSHLYTVRRQLPIVLPALLLLAAYVVLRWAGLTGREWHFSRGPAGLRRVLGIWVLAMLAINFLDAGRPLTREQELAGSSAFVAKLAQTFTSDDIVLFESVDRGAHVGRFAAPLWAEHGVSTLLLSSTYPPIDRLQKTIDHWYEQGRRVYFISQSEPPPFTLPHAQWHLVSRMHWAGSTLAAKTSFPPESWVVEVPLYIYELTK